MVGHQARNVFDCLRQSILASGSDFEQNTILLDLLAERECRGIETYGGTLRTWNGRDSLRDMQEELLDFVAYYFQHAMECDDALADNGTVAPDSDPVNTLRALSVDALSAAYILELAIRSRDAN